MSMFVSDVNFESAQPISKNLSFFIIDLGLNVNKGYLFDAVDFNFASLK